MTNKDNFLKDGVVAEELWKKFQEYYYKNKSKESDVGKAFINFFEQSVTPTLTEDERVILRNIDKHFYTKIFRNECLFLGGEHTSVLVFTQFDHLFQFIKERRRIRDRGVVKWVNI